MVSIYVRTSLQMTEGLDRPFNFFFLNILMNYFI